MKKIVINNIDVLVIGGGIAGTFAAIKAKDSGAQQVVQVDKGHVGKGGNSAFAAGVMHVLLPTNDDLSDRLMRLARAQGYLANQEMLQDHLEQSWDVVKDMESYGVEFERTASGEIERRPGRGAHPIIMFHGNQMMHTLMNTAVKKGIKQFNRTMVTDFVHEKDNVLGAVGFNVDTGDFHVFLSKATVLATGNTWYKGLMPGTRDCTGDGYAAAFRAGAILSGSENNDEISHAMPARYDIGPGLNMFQGLGGKWLNKKGERFMEKYNPALKDRAGLRNITYAFCTEIKRGNGPIYMDMTHFTADQIRKMRTVIPIPTKMFERAGLLANDQFVQPIEWMLCPPTGRPGLVVSRNFETSLKGLFACGEAAAVWAVVTGLSAAATSGATAGKTASAYSKGIDYPKVSEGHLDLLGKYAYSPLTRKRGVEPDQIILSVQENIIPYDITLLRKQDRMEKALKELQYVTENYLPEVKAYDHHYLRIAHEASNMLLTAEIHLKTCIFRKESRVGLREDYPHQDNVDWLKWIEVRNVNGNIALSTKGVPLHLYPIQVEKEKTLHYMWNLTHNLGITQVEKGEIVWV